MKVTRKFGLSFYTLQLTDAEAVKWNQLKSAPNYIKQRERDDIFSDAYVRTYFGSKEKLMKSLNALDKDLTKLDSEIAQHQGDVGQVGYCGC